MNMNPAGASSTPTPALTNENVVVGQVKVDYIVVYVAICGGQISFGAIQVSSDKPAIESLNDYTDLRNFVLDRIYTDIGVESVESLTILNILRLPI